MLLPTNFTVPINWLEEANIHLMNIDHKLSLNEPSGDPFYDRWTVKEEFKDTIWDKLLSVLPINIGEARLIKLGPGTTYTAHADMDDRYHLNIKSNMGYLIDLNNHAMFLLCPDGIWYDMNAGLVHVAANFGNTDRIQLVVRQLLTKHTLTDPVTITINVKNKKVSYRFIFDSSVSPWLNSANKRGVVTNFKFVNDSVTMDIERKELMNLYSVLPEEFEII